MRQEFQSKPPQQRSPGRDVHHRVSLGLTLALVLVLGCATQAAAEKSWTHWGGPDSNFTVEPQPLATSWPEDGPLELWRRPLGHGNSAITVENGVLYTMFREGDDEVVIALNANDGATRWTYRWSTPLWESFRGEHGRGPHSTPALTADRLFTLGIRAELLALDKATGKKIWSRDLQSELGAQPSNRGYASSPMVHDGKVIVPVGSKGHGVVAFDQANGEIVWAKLDFANAFSSPILIDVDGRAQLVLFMAEEVIGVDPENGTLLWQHPHKTRYNVNAMTPVWGDDNILFISSAYDAGSRALRLSHREGKATVDELWYGRSMKVHHGTAVRQGRLVVGSSGDFGPAFVMGVDAETGEVRFKTRGFAKANLLAAGETLIVLDEDGVLGLGTLVPTGFEAQARAQVLSTKAWSVPTLVGTTLYARDWKEIVALDLGVKEVK